jgi:hypothetical protein
MIGLGAGRVLAHLAGPASPLGGQAQDDAFAHDRQWS